MSWWTNYLLLPSISEERDEIEEGQVNENQTPIALSHINAELGVWPFIVLDTGIWCCNTKAIWPHIMIPIIAKAPWKDKEGVQLLIRDERDYKWALLGWNEIVTALSDAGQAREGR